MALLENVAFREPVVLLAGHTVTINRCAAGPADRYESGQPFSRAVPIST